MLKTLTSFAYNYLCMTTETFYEPFKRCENDRVDGCVSEETEGFENA